MNFRFLAITLTLVCCACATGCFFMDGVRGKHDDDRSTQDEQRSSRYDMKRVWEYSDKAKESKRNQQFDLAEKYYLLTLDELKKRDPFRGGGSVANLLARVYGAQGRYSEAIALMVQNIELGKSQLELYQITKAYCILGDMYLDRGDFENALITYEQAIHCAQQNTERDPNRFDYRITHVYPYFGNYYVITADYVKANEMYKEYLKFAEERLAPHNVAIAKNKLARSHLYAEDYETAKKLLEDAAGLNATAFIAFDADLAESLTMLGKISERRSDHEKARDYYWQALNLLEKNGFPGYRTQRADISREIGRFELKQDRVLNSRKAFNEAIQLRKDTGTEGHPNFADALRGLAGVAMLEGDVTSATQLTSQSLQILDKALVPTHPRIAPALVAMGSIHALAGRPELARPLNERIETILRRPLGPWKEDFLETAAFYAERLKQAGKAEEAERLEQLRQRVNGKQAGE